MFRDYLVLVTLRRRRPRWRGIAPLLGPGQKVSRREYSVWHDEYTWDPARDTELTIEDDVSPAGWLAPLLVPAPSIPSRQSNGVAGSRPMAVISSR